MTHQRPDPLPPEAATRFPWPPVLFAAAIAIAWSLTVFAPLPWPGLNDTAAHLARRRLRRAGTAVDRVRLRDAHRTPHDLPAAQGFDQARDVRDPSFGFETRSTLAKRCCSSMEPKSPNRSGSLPQPFFSEFSSRFFRSFQRNDISKQRSGRNISPTRLARGAGSDIRAP